MTYQQYYNQLVKQLTDFKKHLGEQNKMLKGEKGYMDNKDIYEYMQLHHDLDTLSARCQQVSKLLISGDIDPYSEIDPEKLPDIKD